jgi:uncharacterized membrane protein
MNFREELKKTIKTRFISGVLVIVPLFVAIAVLKFVILTIDNFLSPYLIRLMGKDYAFPFIGLLVTICLVILAGILTTNVFGKRLLGFWERILLKIPLFSTVYSASKQLVEGFAVPEKRTFEKAVLVEYPRKGVLAMGFIVNRFKIHTSSDDCRDYVSVFIPTTPTPFAGVAILFPASEINELNISIEDGLKFVVSGSLSFPREIWMSNNDMSAPPIIKGLETTET